MGQSATKITTKVPLKTFTPDVETIQKKQSSQFGEVKLVKDVKTGQEMSVKEIVCHDQETFDKEITYYYNRVNTPHPNLVNVVGYVSDQTKSFCAVNNVIKVYFDALHKNMEQELVEHINHGTLVSEVKLQLLTQHMISILAEFQKKGVAHREISLANIFVTEEAFKLCDPSFTGQKTANGMIKYSLLGVKSLIAPELLKQIPTQDYEVRTNEYKADVFSLGASILSLATLTKSEDLYNFEAATMDLALLEKRIKMVENTYSPTFSRLLRELLTVDEKLRPDFIQLSDRLHIGEVIQSYQAHSGIPSYAKVPYVKIINGLAYSETLSPVYHSSKETSPALSDSKSVSNNSPLFQDTVGQRYVPQANY
jgi:serine/threonine protein kinase